MSHDKKKEEEKNSPVNSKKAILGTLTAILPVVNRMLEEKVFTYLPSDLNTVIKLLDYSQNLPEL